MPSLTDKYPLVNKFKKTNTLTTTSSICQVQRSNDSLLSLSFCPILTNMPILNAVYFSCLDVIDWFVTINFVDIFVFISMFHVTHGINEAWIGILILTTGVVAGGSLPATLGVASIPASYQVFVRSADICLCLQFMIKKHVAILPIKDLCLLSG